MMKLATAYCQRKPVIGILMQRTTPPDVNVVFANYVKAIEGSGGRVVPVWTNQSEEYYSSLLKNINGLVFPGGSANLSDPTDIGGAGRIVYHLAAKLNDEGIHFPILGVCQGFQLMAVISANMKNVLSNCTGLLSLGLPLEFTVNPADSYLYRNATQQVIELLKTQPVTANVHRYCFTKESRAKENLTSIWKVLSINYDGDGLEFISSMEHTRYPFAAVQFHPEKPTYGLGETDGYPHDYNAIVANRWFYDWIIEESKKNNHSYPNGTVNQYVIQNVCPTLLNDGLGWFESYRFPASCRPQQVVLVQ